jgi:hypothetical protein
MRSADDLLGELARDRAARPPGNPLLSLAGEGGLTVEHLRRLVRVEAAYHEAELVAYGVLLARFPRQPAGGFLLEVVRLVQGARPALASVAQRLGEPPDVGDDLTAHAFCGYVSWLALNGSQAAAALALYSDPEGVYYGGSAALVRALEAGGPAVPKEFLSYYGGSPDRVLMDQARQVVADGLAGGDDPGEALRAARLCDEYMALLWSAAAGG